MDLVTILLLVALVIALFGGHRLREPMNPDIVAIVALVIVAILVIKLGHLLG